MRLDVQYYTAIGERIAQHRKYHLNGTKRSERITQAKLADFLQLSRMSVVNMENGKVAIGAFELQKISSLLGVSINDLLPNSQVNDITIHRARLKPVHLKVVEGVVIGLLYSR